MVEVESRAVGLRVGHDGGSRASNMFSRAERRKKRLMCSFTYRIRDKSYIRSVPRSPRSQTCPLDGSRCRVFMLLLHTTNNIHIRS